MKHFGFKFNMLIKKKRCHIAWQRDYIKFLNEKVYFCDYRLDNPEGKLALQFVDYSEKRSLPITIPDYRHIHQVVFTRRNLMIF